MGSYGQGRHVTQATGMALSNLELRTALVLSNWAGWEARSPFIELLLATLVPK